MPLQPGTTLGSYTVTAKIGEGGMGEVYQARDTKLDRDVALKVLPEAFTADPDRLARFEREAKVLASLNHPNIGSIYGLEEADGVRALVLELIEGPTLADRIAQGPIPLDEALPIAKQIAEALEAAHEAGVIHRDLKPANIKVREDGTVKVLDFGLAKALAGDAQGPDLSQSPTMTASMGGTRDGVILGTAVYMSPEQARGQTLDKRTDIWSFGCVLYEMLTGRAAFGGETLSDTIANVIEREPEWAALPANLPAVIGHFLRHCVRKNPRQRVHDVADVRLAMEDAFEMPVTQPTGAASARPAGWLPWVAGLALAVVSSVVVWTLMRPDVVPADVARFVVVLPDTAPVGAPNGGQRGLSITPDGSQIVYTSVGPSGSQLYVRSIDELVGAPLQGGEGGSSPFVSPDGESVGFFHRDTASLKKVSISGGQPVTLTEFPEVIRNASWGPDGQIIFGSTAGLFRVSEAGGEPVALTTANRGLSELRHAVASIIPGANAVLFATTAGYPVVTSGQLAVLDLDTAEVTQLGLTGTSPHYVSTGHLVYGAAGGLVRAVPFDAASLEVTGDPVTLVEGVKIGAGAAHYSLSDTGTLVYVSGGSARGNPRSELVWVDEGGRETPLSLPARDYVDPSLLPDGQRIAVVLGSNSGGDLWVYDAITGAGLLLTQDDLVRGMAWTTDGIHIIFGSNQGASWNLFSVLADGSGDPELLLTSEEWDTAVSVTPDGQTLAFARKPEGLAGRTEIWERAVDGDGPSMPLLQGEFRQPDIQYSPDGNWIVYQSDESGAFEVYVQPYPGLGGVLPVSVGGGSGPMWAAGGSRLLYRHDDQMIAVPFESSASRPIGSPAMLFEAAYRLARNDRPQYDVAPDGRLLMLKAVPDESPEQIHTQVTVVLNWTQELLERVPID